MFVRQNINEGRFMNRYFNQLKKQLAMKTNLIFSAALMLTGACAAFVSCNKELPSVQP